MLARLLVLSSVPHTPFLVWPSTLVCDSCPSDGTFAHPAIHQNIRACSIAHSASSFTPGTPSMDLPHTCLMNRGLHAMISGLARGMKCP